MRALFLVSILLLLPPLSVYGEDLLCEAELNKQKIPMPGEVCPADSRLTDAVKLQITRRLCLQVLDMACLREQAEKMNSTDCLLSARKDPAKRVKCVLEASRKFRGSYSETIFNEWLKPHTKLRAQPFLRVPESDDPDAESGVSVIDVIQTGLSFAPIPYSAMASKILSLEKFMWSSKKSLYDESNECGYASIHIGARRTPNGTCMPSYEFQSPALRTFLGQNDAYVARAMKCKNTCLYYHRLLVAGTAINAYAERMKALPLTAEPKCNSDGSINFTYGYADPRAPRTPQEEQGMMGSGQAYPRNPVTNWSAKVTPTGKGVDIQLSPDQVSPGIYPEPFDRLELSYKRAEVEKKSLELSVPDVQLVRNGDKRKVGIKPELRFKDERNLGQEGHRPVHAGLTLASEVIACCKTASPQDCFRHRSLWPIPEVPKISTGDGLGDGSKTVK